MGFQVQTLAPIITQPLQYSPTLANSTGISGSVFQWWRTGQFINIDAQILFATLGTASAFTFGLPNNLSLDTNFLVGGLGTSNPIATLLGTGYWFDAGVAWKSVWPKFVSATLIGLWDVNQAWANNEAKTNSGLNLVIRSIPILGWG